MGSGMGCRLLSRLGSREQCSKKLVPYDYTGRYQKKCVVRGLERRNMQVDSDQMYHLAVVVGK